MERNLWHLRGTLLVVLKNLLSVSSCPVLLGSSLYGYFFMLSFLQRTLLWWPHDFSILYFSSCAFLLSSQDRLSWNLSTFRKELDSPCAFFYSAHDGTQGLAHACCWDASPAFVKLLLALTPLQSGNPHFCIPDLPCTPRFLFLKQTLAINWHLLLFLVPISSFPIIQGPPCASFSSGNLCYFNLPECFKHWVIEVTPIIWPENPYIRIQTVIICATKLNICNIWSTSLM